MARPSFEFSNMMTAGFRALTYPEPCDDLDRYPVYGDFGSPLFNRSIVPVIARLAPRELFNDAKKLLKVMGAFEDSLIRRLDFGQEIVLGSGRDPVGFYRALQSPRARVIEINLPDFAPLKERLIAEKCGRHDLKIPNLRVVGMDLLNDDLLVACRREGFEAGRDLLVYEVGLTMYLPAAEQEKLFANIDRLFRNMKRRCILLTSSFDSGRHSSHRKSLSLNGLVLLIEKLFRSRIRIDNHAPDAFFEGRGYRIVRGGETLTGDVKLEGLQEGLTITGYVWNG